MNKTIFHKNTRILLINLEKSFGGQEAHVIALHKMLCLRGYQAICLVTKGSLLSKAMQQNKLPFYQTSLTRLVSVRYIFYVLFARLVKRLCAKHNITIIHCNNRFEILGTLRACTQNNIKTIFNRNVPDCINTTRIKNTTAIITPNPAITRYFEQENSTNNLNIKYFRYIPPLFDAERFVNFKTTLPKETFFKKTFNIKLKPFPTLCMIGNMVADTQHKNYPLLFQALNIIINHKSKPIQAILVGSGPKKHYFEQMTRTLHLQDHVYFVGFTDKTPDILYYSDIFALTSSKEAFGIVFLEAGLMKKPAIGAYGTGAELIIVNEKTGLLFKNGNLNDLVTSLERLLDNPAWAQHLGQNAYTHIMKQFAPSVVFDQYAELYATLSSHEKPEYS